MSHLFCKFLILLVDEESPVLQSKPDKKKKDE